MRSKNNLRTWIEVDTKALARNYQAFRKLLARPKGLGIGPKVKLMSVVKSNAYGHGLVDFSKQMVKLGVDWLGVDSIVEAVALRRAGIRGNILVLGYTQPANFSAARKNNIVVTISSLQSLGSLLKLSRPPEFHLKVDTGMHRQGFLWPDFKKILPWLKSSSFTGVYSHLAASDTKFQLAGARQVTEFKKFLTALKDFKLTKHLVSTGGAIAYPAARFDLARIGLGFYGLWPSDDLRRRFDGKIKLSSVLSWKTIISEVKTLPGGGAVGYDFTERVRPGTKLAVCPIGYWHGFPRTLSSVGEVVVRGKLAKVIGRVSMDMIVINVTHIREVKAGDIVTLIGAGLPAERLATLAHTSSYEIITRLNPLIQKFYR